MSRRRRDTKETIPNIIATSVRCFSIGPTNLDSFSRQVCTITLDQAASGCSARNCRQASRTLLRTAGSAGPESYSLVTLIWTCEQRAGSTTAGLSTSRRSSMSDRS